MTRRFKSLNRELDDLNRLEMNDFIKRETTQFVLRIVLAVRRKIDNIMKH